MKLTYSLLFIFLVVTSSCDKELLPIERSYPFTSPVELLTNDGATVEFSGNLITLGEEEILSYGLTWKLLDYRFSNTYTDTFMVQGTPSTDKFSFKSDILFGKNFTYQVNVFAKTKDNIILGSPLIFTSNGTQQNPWTNNTYNTSVHTANLTQVKFRLVSSNNNIYSVFLSNKLFEINEPENEFNEKSDYPSNYLISPLATIKIADFSIGNKMYLWNTQKNLFYCYDEGNDTWETIPTGQLLLTSEKSNTHGFAFNERAYFVDKNFFFKSNPALEINSWTELEVISPIQDVLAVSLDEASSTVYAVIEDKSIWKYDLTQEDSWVEVSTVPFAFGDSFLNFKNGNKIIMGPASSSANENTQTWWNFDITNNSWEEIIYPFPMVINDDLIIKGNQSSSQAFFGVYDTYLNDGKVNTVLWSLDFSKL